MTKLQVGGIAAVVLVAVGTIGYFSRTSPAPKTEEAQGLIGVRQNQVPAGTVCVRPVADYSETKLAQPGMEALLVKQLHGVGLDAKLESEAGGDCAATVYTEIAQLGGRGQKTAQVDFRLVLKGKEVPVLSAEAKGKSGEKEKTMAARNSFVPVKAPQSDDEAKYQEALSDAFGAQAEKVLAAYKQHVK